MDNFFTLYQKITLVSDSIKPYNVKYNTLTYFVYFIFYKNLNLTRKKKKKDFMKVYLVLPNDKCDTLFRSKCIRRSFEKPLEHSLGITRKIYFE